MKGKKENTFRFDITTSETVGEIIEDFSKENNLSYNDTINHFIELGLKLRRRIPQRYVVNDTLIRQRMDDAMRMVASLGDTDDVKSTMSEIRHIRETLDAILHLLSKQKEMRK